MDCAILLNICRKLWHWIKGEGSTPNLNRWRVQSREREAQSFIHRRLTLNFHNNGTRLNNYLNSILDSYAISLSEISFGV